MDYLDPKKQARHRVVLFTGYIFIGIAVAISTLILVYFAYGFGLARNGAVIQNGLVFFSSEPQGAKVYLNDKIQSDQTNAKFVVPEGVYRSRLERSGYRNWQRTLEINGGQVLHVDYPFLIPTTLKTTPYVSYPTAPAFSSQSLDRRWLLVSETGVGNNFDLYDLKSKTKVVTPVIVPATIMTASTGSQSLQPIAWADDNNHLIVKHIYNNNQKFEYLLIDRANPDQSININTTLGYAPDVLTLQNRKYDRYFIYSPSTQILQSATLSEPSPVVLLDHVLAYQTYGTNSFLYATDSDAPAGKVLIKRTIGDQTYTLRSIPLQTTYLLDFTKYAGVEYVVIGSSNENKVYIYKDPIGQIKKLPNHAIVPLQVLHVTTPDFVGFSPSAQFVIAEHGNQFGVFDIFNSVGYNYSINQAIDAPQTHVTWMDGSRLTFVSGGLSTIVDYDGTNLQKLVAANPAFVPLFSPDYKFTYAYASGPATTVLGQTSLLTPADQ